MRRLVVAAAALGVVTSTARAEPLRPKRGAVTAGPIVALHVTSMRGDATLDVGSVSQDAAPKARDRLGIGGFAALRLSDMFDLRVEVLYSQRGSLTAAADPSGESAYEIRYSTSGIAVPVLAAYHVPYDGEFAPRILAGAELLFPLETELDTSATFGELAFDETTDLSDEAAAVDVAAVLGAGMGFPVGGRAVVLDLRYALGLGSAIDEHERSPIPTTTYRASSFRSQTFTVSASFEL